MSKILRRPMFRGGKVDSYGTGIASGLGTRSGYFRGGGVSYNPFSQSQTQNLVQSYTPQGVPQPFIDFFKANQANQRSSNRFRTTTPGSSIEDAEGLLASNTMMTDGGAGIEDLDTTFTARDEIREEAPKLGVGSDFDKDLNERYLINSIGGELERDTGLEAIRQQNIEEIDTSPKEIKKTRIDDDEPEVTMTDLEKALGLDRARQEYAADALAALSKGFFEGRGFEAIADAAQVKSKAPDIKRLAGLEEFKAKKAKELYALKKKEFAPGNFEKNDSYLQKKYPNLDDRQRLKILQKKPASFSEQYIELSKDFGYKNAEIFKDAAFLYFGNDYISDVATDGDMTIGESTPNLIDGVYSDSANELIFEVKDKKVKSKRKF